MVLVLVCAQGPGTDSLVEEPLIEEAILSFTCPEPYGTFADPEQCDLYWDCFEGVAEWNLCDDGLVFDPKLATVAAEPCDTMKNVDCGNRVYLRK